MTAVNDAPPAEPKLAQDDWTKYAQTATLVERADRTGQAPCTVPDQLWLDGMRVPLASHIHWGSGPLVGWDWTSPLNIDMSQNGAVTVEALVPAEFVELTDSALGLTLLGAKLPTGQDSRQVLAADPGFIDAGFETVTVVLVRFYVAQVHITHGGSGLREHAG